MLQGCRMFSIYKWGSRVKMIVKPSCRAIQKEVYIHVFKPHTIFFFLKLDMHLLKKMRMLKGRNQLLLHRHQNVVSTVLKKVTNQQINSIITLLKVLSLLISRELWNEIRNVLSFVWDMTMTHWNRLYINHVTDPKQNKTLWVQC